MFLKNKFFWIFVFLIAIIFCVIKYNPFRIRTMCRVTSSFLLDSVKGESKQIANFPSNFNLLLNKLRLLLLFSFPNKSTNVAGFKVYCRDAKQVNGLFDEIFDGKCYYFETKKSDPFIIDCGSNIGMSVIFFKLLYPKSKILAFEPASVNIKLLARNIAENNLSDIQIEQKALSDKPGKLILYNPGQEWGTLYLCSGSDCKEEVEVAMLSKYINQEVDFLKMDIEGAETGVFEDLAKNNKLCLIKEIILEYHNSPDVPSNNLVKVLKFLQDNNFKFFINANVSREMNFSPLEKIESQTFLIHAIRKD
jgi:FkbM family methyltransferase